MKVRSAIIKRHHFQFHQAVLWHPVGAGILLSPASANRIAVVPRPPDRNRPISNGKHIGIMSVHCSKQNPGIKYMGKQTLDMVRYYHSFWCLFCDRADPTQHHQRRRSAHYEFNLLNWFVSIIFRHFLNFYATECLVHIHLDHYHVSNQGVLFKRPHWHWRDKMVG